MQLVQYHALRVEVELKSSDVRDKLRALDDDQTITQGQLSDEVEKLNSLNAAAEKLRITKSQSEKNLLEVDKKIRLVTYHFSQQCNNLFCLLWFLGVKLLVNFCP